MSDPKFTIGQIVHHRRFDYRGVVYDIDPEFSGTEQWYDEVAKSRPPKDQPWYRVLVDRGQRETYVAERHLEPAGDTSPIDHPLALEVFHAYEKGQYVRNQWLN